MGEGKLSKFAATQPHAAYALTGQSLPGKLVWEMLALPARLGDLGLMNPVVIAEEQHAASQLINIPLVK